LVLSRCETNEDGIVIAPWNCTENLEFKTLVTNNIAGMREDAKFIKETVEENRQLFQGTFGSATVNVP
jgi:hypothetical protein